MKFCPFLLVQLGEFTLDKKWTKFVNSVLVRASLTSCTKQTQTEEIILMLILKIFSATKKLKILAAGEGEVMEQRNQK